jgi:hypothetical protein
MQGVGADMALFDPSSHTKDSSLSMIVGITNPFLLQRLARAANPPYILALNAQQAESGGGPVIHRQVSLHRRAGQRVSSVMSVGSTSSVPTLTKIDVPGSPIANQARPTRFLKTDHKFLDTLAQPETAASSTVRMHFAHLTARILAPVNRSLASNSSNDSKPGKATNSNDKFTRDLPQIATPHVLFPTHKNSKSALQKQTLKSPTSESSFTVSTFLSRLPRDDHAGVPFSGQSAADAKKRARSFTPPFARAQTLPLGWKMWPGGWAKGLKPACLADSPDIFV